MIEAIIALSITLIGFTGVIGILTRSLALNKDISQKFIATYLAAEGIEVVKGLIDYNNANYLSWNRGITAGNYEVSHNSTALVSDTGSFLKFTSSTGIYSYTAGTDTPFKRTITIESPHIGEISVVSLVSWSERGAYKQVDLEDHFFDWR